MKRRATALEVTRIRQLTLPPQAHPRGLPHFSAASALVCAQALAYVIGDDELHLATYRDAASPGQLHRLLPGDLPSDAAARKRVKPDFETLLALDDSRCLLALGSGSTRARDTGVQVLLDAAGLPLPQPRRIDLTPLYAPLRQRLGEINIEGALDLGEHVALLQRGHAQASGNALLLYRRSDFLGLVAGRRRGLAPQSIVPMSLGDIDGVPLAFTDAAALGDGGWVYSAVAEDNANSVADGECLGSAIGLVSPDGQLQRLWRLAQPYKVEGLAVQRQGRHLALCLVTDADDPQQPAWLLGARLAA